MKITFSIISVLIIATILVSFLSGQVPLHLAYDEVEFAKLALSLNKNSYHAYSQDATGHSTLYFYILSASLNTFGVTASALRFPAAVFGVLSTLVLFLILQIIFKKNILASLGAIIFISSHWFLNFSRFSFEGSFLIFLELLALYVTIKYTERGKIYLLIISAILSGLAFHSYYPGRIFFILPAVIILKTRGVKRLSLFAGVLFITTLPLVVELLSQPDTRIYQTTFLTDPQINIVKKIQISLENLLKTIMIPFINGDMNGRHNFPGKPALNIILNIFLLFGIMLTNKFERKWTKKLVYLYIIISILPTILTNPADNPNMLRTITLLPGLIYLIIRGIESAHLLLSHYYPKHKILIGILFAAILITSTYYELRTYFVYQERVMRNSFEITCPLAKVVKTDHIPSECRVNNNLF